MSSPIATSAIVSQAFRILERGPISSLADNSQEARDAAEQYPVALAECLERADWSFASSRRQLAAVLPEADPYTDPELPYLYQLPGDVVRLREVGDGRTHWRLDRDGLRADHPGPLRVRYTGTITDESRLPASFRTAVALRLAWLLGPTYVEGKARLNAIDDDFRTQIKQAMREDARQASEARYDGMADQGDWATEARR